MATLHYSLNSDSVARQGRQTGGGDQDRSENPLFLAVKVSFKIILEKNDKKRCHFRFKEISFRGQIKPDPPPHWSPLGV